MDVVQEGWWQGPTAVMQTIFPSVIIQQQVNSLSRGRSSRRGRTRLISYWTHFGFADDTPDDRRRRLKRPISFRPASLSLDDGEVIEYCQQATSAYPRQRMRRRAGQQQWHCQPAHGHPNTDSRHTATTAGRGL